jgi:lysophospholipase L1-like esterase
MNDVPHRARAWWRALVLLLIVGGLGYGTVWLTKIRPARLQAKAAAAEAKARKKAEKKARRPAQSVVARTGLPTLRRKMAAHEPVTIAFLGGSITQNSSEGGFVSMIPQWVESQAPGVKVTVINAGLAATGSDFGAKRVSREVLAHHPDVVVVEFAVNDAPRECAADMEQIVRRIRLANPQTDIVFIYTVMNWSLPMLDRGTFPKSVKQHEQVAAHYGLPTVALGYVAAQKIRTGEWTWKNFSPDDCHPTPAGYASYNQDLEAALPALLAASQAHPENLPASLTPGLNDYPEPSKALPFPPPEAMFDAGGVHASETWELPKFGVHWIGAPEFPGGPESPWRLYFQPTDSLVDDNTASRQAWRAARWFEEDHSFTGRSAHAIVRFRPDAGNLFGANPTDSAVLTWRAPAKGRYLFRIAHGGVEGAASGAETATRLKALLLPQAGGAPQELQFPPPPDPKNDLILEQQASLEKGDEVAFVFLAKGYKYAAYKNFRVTIGRFPEEKK